jgi:hypothetical protein
VTQRRQPTTEEKRWLRRLERVLLDAPYSIGLYTIGDHDLTAYDRDVVLDEDIRIEDGGAEAAGVVLGTVRSRVRIDGVSG